MLPNSLVSKLEEIVGEKNISTDKYELLAYTITDRSYVSRIQLMGLNLKPEYMYDCVVWPQTTEQVSEIVKLANKYRVPIIPYGGGTNDMGGTVPLTGGIAVDLKRLDKIIEINERSARVHTQAGVILQILEWELNKHGLTTGHAPACMYDATIGGTLSTRSSGSLSNKYGKIPDMTLGLEVVLPTGEIVNIKPVPEGSTGPALKHLFLGAEGVFGIITSAVLRTFQLPEVRRFRSVLFKNLHNGIEAGRKIMQSGISPAAIRLSDEAETMKNHKMQGCYCVFCFEGPREIVDAEEKIVMKICQEEGAEDLGSEEGKRWWERKYYMYYSTPRSSVYPPEEGKIRFAIVPDTAASYDEIEPLYYDILNVVKKYGISVYSHFSHWYPHGTMVYPVIYFNVIDNIEEAMKIYTAVWNDIAAVILKYKTASLNHHHGVGFILGRYLDKEYGEPLFRIFKEIKKILDPNGIMNPGKLGL
ncbi:TPA: FAD-binding oxidoreductase [Candidatus Poribacteria bacterium]|jgi:alkyldihydroxyacetonephosphate synthase|nr:FAD-binding oxidoreductase [Candidatus Poribacteria bacterium]